jgi:prephenate dehydrogenase
MGLIGGSLARDLKSQINVRVLGVDANPDHHAMAEELAIVDEMVSLDRAMEEARVVILAIPVDAIERLLPELLDRVSDEQIISDVGSTKGLICKIVAQHANRNRYVAAHPLAGTEYSGPQAAISHLFVGKKNIICEADKSDKDALQLVEKIFNSVGLTNLYMDPVEHDKHLAYVSHLSHVSSFMLGLTVLDIEKDEKQIFNLASTGFASTVRLAKSNPKTWSAIFTKNDDHLSIALGSYIGYLKKFKKAIDDKDLLMVEALMIEANDIKKILN